MNNSEDLVERQDETAADLRIGAPERESARVALDAHHAVGRLDDAEREQRLAACEAARTHSELLESFADLPAPHPDLPCAPEPSPADDDISLLGWAIGVALVLGLPVAIVLGFAYDAWWSLAVPVGLCVMLLYVEHLLTRTRDKEPPSP